MFYCDNCKNEFEEPKKEKTTYEAYYGVDDKFADKHEMSLEKCPYCGSEDFEEMPTCDRCGEFCCEHDLVDTETSVGGDIGNLCPDCARDCEV